MTALPQIEPEAATGAAAELLAEAQRTFGITPNFVKALANSPPALRGYLAFVDALREGTLSAAAREQIALLVAQENRCDYCLSVHAYVGERLAGLTVDDVGQARAGQAADARTARVLDLAGALIRRRGGLTDDEVDAARAVLSPDEFVEVIAHVALDVFGNYLALAGRIGIDWPLVRHDHDHEH
jgi:uncharacterized peroxidase-related enzyme